MLPIIENAMEDGNTMDGKCSPFPLLILVPKATQHIRSPLHCLSPCQLKKLFYRWEVLPIWHIPLTGLQHLRSFSSYLQPDGLELVEI
jgi:hypothetical protein